MVHSVKYVQMQGMLEIHWTTAHSMMISHFISIIACSSAGAREYMFSESLLRAKEIADQSHQEEH
jgi:hypothetical protein